MCLITRGDSTVDVIAMGRRGDEDMQIFRHGEFVYPWLEWRAHDVTVTRERQSTAEGRIALGSKKRPPGVWSVSHKGSKDFDLTILPTEKLSPAERKYGFVAVWWSWAAPG